MSIPSALNMVFFSGMVTTLLVVCTVVSKSNTMRIVSAMSVLAILILVVFDGSLLIQEGVPVDASRLSAGEYPILSIAKRDKDDKAYLVVENGKDVRLVSVKRSSIEGKSPSMMKVEKEEVKKIPKKFVFD